MAWITWSCNIFPSLESQLDALLEPHADVHWRDISKGRRKPLCALHGALPRSPNSCLYMSFVSDGLLINCSQTMSTQISLSYSRIAMSWSAGVCERVADLWKKVDVTALAAPENPAFSRNYTWKCFFDFVDVTERETHRLECLGSLHYIILSGRALRDALSVFYAHIKPYCLTHNHYWVYYVHGQLVVNQTVHKIFNKGV